LLDLKNLKQIVKDSDQTLVLPIGGCGEFGLNMTIYIKDTKVYVVDTGLMFPEHTKLGVDAIVPNMDPIFAAIGRPTAYLITHGHEDHIGALPHFFRRWSAPIYCTAWTRELIYDRFGRTGQDRPTIHTMKAGDHLKLANITVDWIHVNHSIPMCCSLLIRSEDLSVYHTGDFKFDDRSPYEIPMTEASITKVIGSRGVDLLLADSTNAMSTGDCPGESQCIEAFDEIFPNETGNVFVATFSSNLWRLLSIVKSAAKSGRKVHFAGTGILRTVEVARLLDMFQIDQGTLQDFDEMSQSTKGIVYICTGCQGEPLAALSRILRDEYRGIKLKADDTVIFSSRMIPGSERAVAYMMSECARRGTKVYTTRSHPKVHVSGHAYQGDLLRLLKAVKPKWVLPVHGTFSHLRAHGDFAEVMVQDSKIFDLEDGVLFCLEDGEVSDFGQIDIEWLYIDGFVKSPIDLQNLNKRLRIGELGLVIFSGVYSDKQSNWHGEVFIDLRGLVLPNHVDPDEWHTSCRKQAAKTVRVAIEDGVTDAAGINERVRVSLRQLFTKVFRKKVVVAASIHHI
jgi:ribonuclease J